MIPFSVILLMTRRGRVVRDQAHGSEDRPPPSQYLNPARKRIGITHAGLIADREPVQAVLPHILIGIKNDVSERSRRLRNAAMPTGFFSSVPNLRLRCKASVPFPTNCFSDPNWDSESGSPQTRISMPTCLNDKLCVSTGLASLYMGLPAQSLLSYHTRPISYHVLSYPRRPYSIPSHPILPYPILSYPVLPYPILHLLRNPILSYPIQSYPF